jgi:F420 biosynthesis protein FbiB-like protein
MQTLDAIAQRRSIRKFKDTSVPEEEVRAVLQAATLAPSGKNRQPWRFVVVQGDERRAEMVALMRQGIARVESYGEDPGSSKWTAGVMEQAPVTIFVFDGLKTYDDKDGSWVDVDVQSIGAAIQNMLLAALDHGLGTLWICDVFYAVKELCGWLDEDHVLVAAVSLGYPDQEPDARPRKSVDEVTRWVR